MSSHLHPTGMHSCFYYIGSIVSDHHQMSVAGGRSQVSSDNHQMSVAEGGVPCLVSGGGRRFHVWYWGMEEVPCLVLGGYPCPNASWVTPQQNDRHLWKHYLSQIRLRAVNIPRTTGPGVTSQNNRILVRKKQFNSIVSNGVMSNWIFATLWTQQTISLFNVNLFRSPEWYDI